MADVEKIFKRIDINCVRAVRAARDVGRQACCSAVKDLRLSTYSSSDEIFQVLDNRFGNQATIALEIVEELQATPPVRSGQPRKIIELIQALEKALFDLNELGNADAIKNPLVTKSIESKLPETLKKDWLTYAADERNAVNYQNRFDKLITFLRSQESIYKQLDQLRDVVEPTKEKIKFLKHARTKTTKSSSHSRLHHLR
ncbi:hypothetical protein L3Q82_004076 [Scortum barcoo]|uniref:Uncharacterized protein n=1 Tax=Scortum barcoo TaxID=214431 RepID=A0ACB8X8C8_9TELE|nr:hypothetical protein L3Q82_004076 [Scortum barcoo]